MDFYKCPNQEAVRRNANAIYILMGKQILYESLKTAFREKTKQMHKARQLSLCANVLDAINSAVRICSATMPDHDASDIWLIT